MTAAATRRTLADAFAIAFRRPLGPIDDVFGTEPHGPVSVEPLGGDTYRLVCADPRHPAALTTVTSPGGVRAWRREHASDGRQVEHASGGDLL